MDPTADLLRQLRATKDDHRWCDLLGELNRALVRLGELKPTYTMNSTPFATYGCEQLARPEGE